MTLLGEAMEHGGAVRDETTGRLAHFGDERAELRYALTACAAADCSGLGRILAKGPDLLDLLQRLSTGDLRGLCEGEGRSTILTTPKGRIVERLVAHHLGEAGVLLACGSDGAPRTIQHLDRFTFREKTGLTDITGSTCRIALVGPRAAEALSAAGLDAPAGHAVVEAGLGGEPVRVLGGDGIGGAGYSVVCDAENAGTVWDRLVAAAGTVGGRPAGERAMESRRLLLGLPVSPHELNDDHNPLEAGLRDAVSFDKGCYVGQEVVARLNTYDKVSRSLVGLEIPADGDLPAPGTEIVVDGAAAGRVTSVACPPGWPHAVALAYLKHRSSRPTVDLRLAVGSVRAKVVELPFDISQL